MSEKLDYLRVRLLNIIELQKPPLLNLDLLLYKKITKDFCLKMACRS